MKYKDNQVTIINTKVCFYNRLEIIKGVLTFRYCPWAYATLQTLNLKSGRKLLLVHNALVSCMSCKADINKSIALPVV